MTGWKEAKKRREAWAHIRIDLTGGGDTCQCVICKVTVSLNSRHRSKDSILLETARVHFYKHKIFENLARSQ